MAELVEIWVVPLDRPDGELRGLCEALSPEERMRAGDHPLGLRKRRYVARQAALRTILAERIGTPPDQLSFVRTGHGKPELAGEHEVRFSVSDSADLALVALARRDVGVDVERVRDRPVAARAAALGIDGFFQRWTRFEAAGKARGTGIFGRTGEDGLSCSSLDVGPGYAAAVAVTADRVEVRLRPY